MKATGGRASKHCGFVVAVASGGRGGEEVRVCSRRSFVARAAAAGVSCILAASGATAMAEADVAAADGNMTQAQLQELAMGDAASLATFVDAAESGRVERVWFFGNRLQVCFYRTRDGDVLQIGDGYPVEAARSPESPLHIVARIRNL